MTSASLLLNAPGCAQSPVVQITGSVLSCTNAVASISYALNGGPEQTICLGCGIDPAFGFELNLSDECTDNTLVVTATNTMGGVSSITTAIHYDATPPVITCPEDIQVSSGTDDAVPESRTRLARVLEVR